MGMAFKKVLEEKKSPETMATELFDLGTLSANKASAQHRDSNLFHVSSAGYCMRSVAWDREHGKLQELSFLRKVNLGTSIHELYQEFLAHSGKLFGMYYCKECKGTFGPQYASTCEVCGGKKLMQYSEVHLINHELKISGHPDGFMNLGGKIKLIEIKTITGYAKIGDGPERVDAYAPEHKHQVNLYLKILQHPATMFLNADKAVFLANLDFSEYLMMYHDKGSDKMIPYAFRYDNDMATKDLARIKSYHECVAAKQTPPAEPMMRKCKFCNYVSQCSGLVD